MKLVSLFTFFCILSLGGKATNAKLIDENKILLKSTVQVDLSADLLSFKILNYLRPIIENNGDCSTPYQDKKLEKGVSEIENVINGAFIALEKSDISRDSLQIFKEHSMDIYQSYLTGSQVSCLSCGNLVNSITNKAQVLFNALTDADPALKTKLWFDLIVTTVDSILQIVKDICGQSAEEPLSLIDLGSFEEDQGQCLSKEQKDDVEEVIQLAGNLLNTFSEWLKETEAKAQSTELKSVIDELSKVLAKGRDELEKNGETEVEKLCQGCSKVIKFTSNVVNFAETIMKTFVPFWKKVPKLEEVVAKVDELLEEARTLCPTEYYSQGLQKFESTKSFDDAHIHVAEDVFDNLKATISNLQEVAYEHSKGYSSPKHTVFERKSFETVYVALTSLEFTEKLAEKFESNVRMGCKEILQVIEDVLDDVEQILDEKLPVWRKLPFVEVIDSFVHKALDELSEVCPNAKYVLNKYTKHSITGSCLSDRDDIKVKHLTKKIDSLLENVEEGVELIKDNLPLHFLDAFVTEPLEKFLLDLKLNLNKDIYWSAESGCSLCESLVLEGKSALSEIKSIIENQFPTFKDNNFVLAMLNSFEHILDTIEGFCKEIFAQDIEYSVENSMESCINTLPIDQTMNEVSIWLDQFVITPKLRASSMSIGLVRKSKTSMPCLKCISIIEELEDDISKIEAFLTKVFPEWEEIPLMSILDNFVHEILDFVQEHCPSSIENLNKFTLIQKTKCLSSDNKSNLDHLVHKLNSVFDDSLAELDSIANSVDIEVLDKVIEKLEANIEVAKSSVDEIIYKTANTLCLDCKVIDSNLSSVLRKIKSELTEFIPNWEANPVLSNLYDQLCEVEQMISNFCPRTRHFHVKKTGCLTELQKEKMSNITEHVKVGLEVAANILELRGDFEQDPMKKYAFKEAAKVVKIVGSDVVTNLTVLADEFCGSCPDIFDAVKDTFSVLEEALFDVEPMWKNTPLYSGIVDLTNKVFDELEGFCKVNLKSSVAVDCLTPEEKNKLKGYISTIDGFMTYTSDTLKAYAAELAEGSLKDELEELATTLEAVDHDLVQKFTKIADETCGTCLDIVKGMKDFETAVESAMSDVDPDWRQNPKYSGVATAVAAVIELLEGVCPRNKKIILSAKEKSVVQHLFQIKDVALFAFNDEDNQVSSVPKTPELLISWLKSTGSSVESDNSETGLILSVIKAALISIRNELNIKISSSEEFLQSRQLEVLRDAFDLMETEITTAVVRLKATGTTFSCGAFIAVIEDAVEEVRKLIEEVIPTFANSGIFKSALDAVDSILKIIHDICPNVKVDYGSVVLKRVE